MVVLTDQTAYGFHAQLQEWVTLADPAAFPTGAYTSLLPVRHADGKQPMLALVVPVASSLLAWHSD